MEDIVLFLKYNFHKAILEPVSKCLIELNIPHTLTGKRHLVYDHFDKTKKKFKIIFIADEWTNLFRDQAEILIAIGHSPAGKNTTFDIKNKGADYIFAFSQYYKTEYLRRGVVPKKEIIVTGNPAADRIFNKRWNRESWWYQDALKRKLLQVNLLFAPTYNRDLSLIDELIRAEKESKFFEKLFSDPMIRYRIAFKGHPVLNKKYPQQVEEIKKIESKYGQDLFYYHEDSHGDITDAILWSSLIVGDSSGAILLGVAGDKPIFAFNNPNRERSEYYDFLAPEWSLRDKFATSFTSFDDLINLIHGPDFKKESRTEVKHLLYGEHQGGAAFQIANYIKNLL